MSPNAPEAEKIAKDAPPPSAAPESTAGPTTDEDILRLRSRLDREVAVVAQKLADAEETIIDIEMALRSYETGSRPRLPSAAPSGEKGTERSSGRFKAVGDGFSKIKDWVVKRDPKESESPEVPSGAKPPSQTDLRAPGRGAGDLEDRLEEAVRSITAEIRDRERDGTELDRKLHEAQKELIRQRAQEQQAREMQLRIGQTKQLSEDLERRMAMLDEMVKTFETSMKTDTGFRTKPKEVVPAAPKFEDRLQAAVDSALKSVAAQEKKVADLEKELERANASLVEERARQQRVRAMQVRLRQARYLSTDLQRALSGVSSTIDGLHRRAGSLLRPDRKTGRPEALPAKASS